MERIRALPRQCKTLMAIRDAMRERGFNIRNDSVRQVLARDAA
jgi:hypothetical protein